MARILLRMIVAGVMATGALLGCGDAAESSDEQIVITTDNTMAEDKKAAEKAVDDGSDVEDLEDPLQPDKRDPPDETARKAPTYDGTCPTFVEGANTFKSSGADRRFRVELPANPEGAPVVFAWHWLNGNADLLVRVLGLGQLADAENVIIIAPESDGGTQFEWRFTEGPENNTDLQLFEDLLACSSQQYEVDLDRIYSTGHSAGGLWTSYLTMHASKWLAATAVMSGGSDARSYSTPENKVPVLVIWGGPTDNYGGFNFGDSSRTFSTELQNDSHFVVMCEHTQGHVPPTGAMGFIWQWFEDHPSGVAEPYADGLPNVFPDYCLIP